MNDPLAYSQEDYVEAYTCFHESLVIHKALEDKGAIAHNLTGIATVLFDMGEHQKAVCLWGAADALREALSPIPRSERDKYDQQVTRARAVLGDSAFAAAWEVGDAMTLQHAVAYALEEVP